MAFFYFRGMEFVNYNGRIVKKRETFIPTDDHAFRYGTGLFETMKVREGKILLSDLHIERLFAGLILLKYKIPAFFTRENIHRSIIGLCIENKCSGLARVRLSV